MDPGIYVFMIFLIVLFINYLFSVWMSRNQTMPWELDIPIGGSIQRDGFEGFEDIPKTQADETSIKWIESPELFDDFYSQVYDQLVQGAARTQAEVGLALHAFTQNKKKSLTDLTILDAGCGTGIATAALAKMNVKKVIAVDQSAAMIKHAKEVTLPGSTLTQVQKDAIEFRQMDLMNPSALQGGEADCAICFYFVLYYLRDHETFFRNMFHWIKPGGTIAIEVVNKYKFDPMLDSSAPWIGFSLQKYSKDRITKSEVVFDKFRYEGKFDLIDPVAEFRETFRFKDGSVRRQKHTLLMPSIEEIVKIAKIVGWEYKSYVDLTTIGFEYAYLLLFTHP